MTARLTQGDALIEVLTTQLRACTSVSDGIAPPVAILWADPQAQWRTLVPTLLKSIPELLIYGDYDPDVRSGPAIWLRCMVDRALESPALPDDCTPIIYLPGVSRQQLRAGEDCPDVLQPLVELMYRGTLWLQRGGHDWTATAFMTSDDALGLELSGDNQTTEALLRALPEFAAEPLTRFQGRRLEADDFDQMLAADVVRDLLLWMNDPAATRKRFGADRWAAFQNQCKQQFHFDPDTDGETVAGEQLGTGDAAWASLWERFEEAPANYPGIPDLLRRSKPSGLIFEASRWPDENQKDEDEVRRAFGELAELSHAEANARVLELEAKHGARRSWVWSQLDHSPMARVLAPLAELARHARTAIGGQSPDDIAHSYIESGWRADHAAWQAIAMAKGTDIELVRGVVQRLLASWMDDSARAFQGALNGCPLPDHAHAEAVTVPESGCLVFADGLRYDLGEDLRDRLEAHGCRVRMDYRWAAIPTVTATAKPAVTPVVNAITGDNLREDFAPLMADTKKPVNAGALRDALRNDGFQVLAGGMGDWPETDQARGWTEEGKIDTRGHQLQGDLPQILDKELEGLTDRIIALFDGGWQTIRVVTDHGWVYLPLGLPKVELPKHLTASKWARCAAIAGESQVDVPMAPWHWNTAKNFATAPGIACFTASNCYAHGGLSIQECLTPDMHIERVGGVADRASIESVTWKGMRCFVVAADVSTTVTADLRLATPAGQSVAAAVKSLDEDGSTSLLLEDDEYELADLVVVLLGSDGKVLAKHKTKVGIDS